MRIQIIKIKLSIKIVNLAEWISPRQISKESVLEEAKKIYPYAIILWSDDDMWTYAFRLFIDRKIINKNQAAKFVRKAELQRKSKAKKQAEYINAVKQEMQRKFGKSR